MTQRPDTDLEAAPQSRLRPRRRAAMSGRDEEILRSLADRIDAEDAGAHNNLGVVFYQKGLVEDAVRAFERALELDPRLDVARSNVEVAYRESGYFDHRVELLRQRVRRDPSDAEARDALARTFLLGGEPGAAAREWAALLESRPDHQVLHMKLAYAEAEQGRLAEALRLVQRALRRDPVNPALHLQRAELLERAGHAEAALVAVRRTLELDPESARGHLLLGRVLAAAGREAEAAEARSEAVRLDPDVVPSEQHLSLERYRSVRDIRSRRGGRPAAVDGSLGRLARSAELRQAGDLVAAAAELRRARAEEDTFEVRQALAEVLLLQGDLEAALRLYERLLEDQEESPKLWNERGVAFHRLGRLGEAVDAYRHAVAMDYAYALGWNNLGVARAQLEEDGPAERALRKAAEDATAIEILWNLGLFLNLHGEVDESAEVYRAAVRTDGGRAESWSRLGSALFQSDRAAEAREALERALELDPGLAEARYQLGFVLSALGDFRGALRETKQAMEQEAVFPAPHYQLLMDVQFEDGALPAPEADTPQRVPTGEAIETFELDTEALDRAFDGFAPPEPAEPGEIDALMSAAETARRRGRLQRAADRVARAVALAPTPAPRLLQARIYLDQGLAGEALERYDEVLDGGDPAHRAEAAEGRARALLVLGRADEAVPAAQEAVALGAPEALLGHALLQKGDTESAVTVLEEAVAAGDERPRTLRAYGQALLGAGRLTDAELRFREALRQGPSAAAHVGLARTLEALGDWDAAEQAYASAVDVLPSYGPAALGLAGLRWRAGRRMDALQGLVDFLELDPGHVDGLVRLGVWLYEVGRPDQAVRALERAARLDPDHDTARAELERIRGGR